MSKIQDCLTPPAFSKFDANTGHELSPLIQAISRDCALLSVAISAMEESTHLGDPAFFRHALGVAAQQAAVLARTLREARVDLDEDVAD